MTLRAVAGVRVSRIGHIELPRCCLGTGMEARVLCSRNNCAGRDGVIVDAHPHKVGLVATGTPAGNARMDLCTGWCRRRKTAARRGAAGIGFNRPSRERTQVAAFTRFR